jgi:hypothetical protein
MRIADILHHRESFDSGDDHSLSGRSFMAMLLFSSLENNEKPFWKALMKTSTVIANGSLPTEGRFPREV